MAQEVAALPTTPSGCTTQPLSSPAPTEHAIGQSQSSDAARFQKRMFPGWQPIEYKEWDLYPDQKERRHDRIWRGFPTTNEVTIERALGRSQHGGDTRNGIALLCGGDKAYPSPEYAPGFFLSDMNDPLATYRDDRYRSKPQSIVPTVNQNTVNLYAEKRRLAERQAEMEEVRRLDDWEPKDSGPAYLS